MKKTIMILTGLLLSLSLAPPVLPTYAWTEELMQTRCTQFVGNPASESNKVYVATVNGEKSTYLKMMYNTSCDTALMRHARDNGYNAFTRNLFGSMIVHRPASDKYGVFHQNSTKGASSFFVKLNTTACAHGKKGTYCNSNFYTDGGHAGNKEYLYAGVSNAGVPVMNSYFPVDTPCSTYSACFPSGYPWRATAWDSGNISKTNYDSATSGTEAYKIKTETVRRFLSQEGMGSDVSYYRNRFSLVNDGEMEAGVLYGSSSGNNYNVVVAAAPKTATRNVFVESVTVAGSPTYVKGSSNQVVKVVIRNSGDLGITATHIAKVSYTDSSGRTVTAEGSWYGTLGAGSYKTIDVTIAMPSATQTITIKGAMGTDYRSYNQWSSDDSKTTSVKVDGGTPAMSSVTISRNNAWGNTNVSMYLDVYDAASGTASMQYAMWNGDSSTVVQGWTEFSRYQTLTISREGITRIQLWARDKVGNERYSDFYYAKIDKSNPTGSITVNTENWQNANSVTATLYASDSVSGVADAQYRLTGATSKDWTKYTNGTQISISNQGETKIEIWVKDNAGNSTYPATKYVRIDRTNPTNSVTLSRDNTWGNTNVTATFYTGDTGGSGLKSSQYAMWDNATGNAVVGWTNYSNGNSTTISREGITKVQTWSQDWSNNAVYGTIKYAKIDKTNPYGSITVNTESWQNVSSVNATLAAGDALSGVKQARYRLTGATSKDWADYTNGQVITITNEGETKIEIWIQDQAGNVYGTSKTVRIDRSDPTGSINFNHENWQNASSITVTLTAGDGVSGVKTSQYRLTGATTKDWTNYSNGNQITVSNQGETKVEIKITDQANRSITRTKTVRLDRTNPTLSVTQNPTTWTNQNVTLTVNARDNLALWGLTAYKDSIRHAGIFSSAFPRNNGKILIITSDNTSSNAGFTRMINDFRTKLSQLGMSSTVLTDTQFTSASQATGYQAVFHLAFVWNNDARASLINQIYNNNIPVFTSGNDCGAGTSIVASCGSSRTGIYTLNKSSNNFLGELVHGGSRSDNYYFATPAWSTSKLLATVTHADGTATSAGILHHTNENSVQWIHHQGADESLSLELLTSAALLLAQRNTTLTTSLTHTFTITQNGSYPITVYDLAGNRTTHTQVINIIDRNNPIGSVVIDKGQDFLNDEETTLHLTFNDLPTTLDVASGIKSLNIFDVNGSFSHMINEPSGTSMSIPWVLTPWEAPDGALKTQVGVVITDRAGNQITVYSQMVDIIKVYVTDFYLTNVLNPTVYNSSNPFKTLTYPNIPAQQLLAGGNFSYKFNYYHPKNVNSKWKIDYIWNVRYKKPNGTEQVLTSKLLKQQVLSSFTTQHIIPYDIPKGTKVYLDLELVLYDQNGRKVATGYFPQPQNTSLLVGTIQEDIRKILQFNEFN